MKAGIIDNTATCKSKKHKDFWVIHVKGTPCPHCEKREPTAKKKVKGRKK